VQTWNIRQIYPYKAWSPCSGTIKAKPFYRSNKSLEYCLWHMRRLPEPCARSVLTLVLGEYAIHRLTGPIAGPSFTSLERESF
jgi:hypothetical protein